MEPLILEAPSDPPASGGKYPPMLMQYLEYKEEYPDCLLFFQVGDFFELFFDDAKTVAKVINLTLTSRDKNNPNPVPMCGVPVSVADNYAERLVDAGYSVAIVRQTEAPTGKGMVTRRLERIVTPGIRVLGGADSSAVGTVVGAIAISSPVEVSLAYTDVQSGRISVRDGLSIDQLAHEVGRLSLSELVLPRQAFGKPLDMRTQWVRALCPLILHNNIKFRSEEPNKGGRTSQRAAVPGYLALTNTSKRAVELLVQFVEETTVELTLTFASIETKTFEDIVHIDSTTRANLELVKNSKDGSERGTLYEYLRETVTPGGSRVLREWITQPLLNSKSITARLNSVEDFYNHRDIRERVRSLLRIFPDAERIATRIELGIVTPRELGALRDSVATLDEIVEAIHVTSFQKFDSKSHDSLKQVSQKLSLALVESPPLAITEGGIFQRGYDKDLDHYIDASTKGKSWMDDFEAKERAATGISSLKVKYNGVFGYFIEITATNLSKVPPHYIRRQTTANAERYITEELKNSADDILGASDKRIEREKVLFSQLRQALASYISTLRIFAQYAATLDILLAFAEIAEREGLVRPEVTDSDELQIVNGKHPQLSFILRNHFIPNSVKFDKGDTGHRCLIITGPNMGGKSTYLRQTALITILAQIGSFVPAASARIGIVDKIFARLGASDNIVEGESTFMVEMREAGSIIRNATAKSLLLIDEIGRGTATADGLALAQAILEWIVVHAKSRTLFATHFHELTELSTLYESIHNVSVGSVEQDGGVLFTHEIHEGPANKSYGIEVARLAGLPKELLRRASELLGSIRQNKNGLQAAQLTLFSAATVNVSESVPSDYSQLKGLKSCIEKIDINRTTPIEALQVLSELQAKIIE